MRGQHFHRGLAGIPERWCTGVWVQTATPHVALDVDAGPAGIFPLVHSVKVGSLKYDLVKRTAQQSLHFVTQR